MDRKIAVIGGGFVGKTMLDSLHEQGIEVVVIDDLIREATVFTDTEPFEITRLPVLEKPYEWKCKGFHEYRPFTSKEGSIIKTDWICQCGRKL